MKHLSVHKRTALSAAALALPSNGMFGAQNKASRNESEVAKFILATTLAEQEKQL